MSKEEIKNETNKVSKTINGVFTKVKNTFIPIDKRKYDFSAKQAWIGTTYGKERCLVSLEQQIENKRHEIRTEIEQKYRGMGQCQDMERGYFHIVYIEGNLSVYAEEIMYPFKELGFEVVNLSALTPVLNDTTIYLISWRNAFKQKEDCPSQENTDSFGPTLLVD